MSKLEELIQKFCPNGVDYKTLGELGDFHSGLTGKSKDDFTDGNANLITYMNVYKNPAVDLSDTTKVKIGINEKQRKIKFSDVIFTGSSETPDECALSSVVCEKPTQDYYLNSFCFIWEPHNKVLFNPKFLKHLFRSSELRDKLGKTASGVTRFNVSKDKMKKVSIPVPPIEVQHEIVRLLDIFTELAAELAAELTARLKQYEFYKNQLLEFNKNQGIPFIKINELASYRRGSFPQPYGRSEWYDGEGAMAFVQVADIGDDMRLVTNTKRKISIIAQSKSVFAPKGSIIISLQGSIGRIAITQYDAFIDRTVAIFNKLSDKLVPKYFVYQLQRIFAIKEKTARGSTIKTITKEEFTDFLIPVPPIDKQEYIVSILDRFDQVCNDITSGLPAEIAARQKQYEYYRNKLLTFKELKA